MIKPTRSRVLDTFLLFSFFNADFMAKVQCIIPELRCQMDTKSVVFVKSAMLST